MDKEDFDPPDPVNNLRGAVKDFRKAIWFGSLIIFAVLIGIRLFEYFQTQMQ